ncbi:MAG: YfhO family protein, partial [Lachnospiraceae bacterium]|nr:YfhO family protein [Lachnospiraceae bacterium]
MEQSKKNTDGKTLLWLWLLILGGCLLIFHSFLLGNETLVFADVGSDTKQQYIMWYNGIVNHLREGSFAAWDFNNGFGVNELSMSLTEPFLMLVYFLGTLFGPENITLYMVYIQILKILLAGTACYYFLSAFSIKEPSKLLAAFMYAFNGYLMVWGQHYQLGSVVVWMPLLLLFIEKTLKNWKYCFGVAAMSGITILSGFYQGYMVMLGCGIYVCIRVLLYDPRSWKKKWSRFGLEAISMGFGVLMGALNLFPSISTVLGTSSRLSAQSSLLQRIVDNISLWPGDYYKTAMYRLFGSNLQGSANQYGGYANYYEAVSLFFSTLFIILLLQYVFTIHRQKNTGKLQKAAQYIGVAAGVFTVAVELGSLIFNGFAYAFSRHTFLLMPFFALLCGKVLDQILEEKKISWIGMFLSLGAILVVYAKAYRNMDDVNYKTNALMLCLTGLAMAAALIWSLRKKADQKLCYQILLLALFVNILSDTTLCYRYRATLKKNDISYYQDTYESSVNRALAWLEAEDNSFYRIEKDFHNASSYMDSLAQNYMSVSTYNSTQNSNIAKFVSTLWPQLLTGYDNNHYEFTNTVNESTMAALTGVKYLLSKNAELNVPDY